MKRDTSILIIALLLPTLITWIYFVQLSGPGKQPNIFVQIAYALGKIVQFGLPLAFVYYCHRQDLSWQRPKKDGLLLGVAFGLGVAVAMWVLYVVWLKPAGIMNETATLAAGKLREFACDTPLRYFLLAAFYALVHSLLEEYYWRWFVFGYLRRLLPLSMAVVVASLGFMLHHVILLWVYFPDYFWILAVPFSLCVAVGGAVWCVLYQRTNTLFAPWMSHLLVDAAIFLIGYDLVRGVLR